MITELKEAMASGLGEMSKRLMDLDGKASEGFADVRAALERSDEAVREGVDELHPIEHAIMPDRIEAGTFAVTHDDGIGRLATQSAAPRVQEHRVGVSASRPPNGRQ